VIVIDIGSLTTRLAASIAAVLFALLAPATGFAQVVTGPTETTTQSKAAEPIPAEQIPARASSARVTLDAIRAPLLTPRAAEKDDLAAIGMVIDQLRQQPDFSRLDHLPEFRISELQRQVRFYRRELEQLEARDVARATRLSADAAQMSRLRATWNATLAAVRNDSLSRPLVEEVLSVLALIEGTEVLLERPLAEALAGRQRAGRYEARLETLAQFVAEAGSLAKGRRLSRDVEPIWAPGVLAVAPERGLAAVQARIDEQLGFSRNYLIARWEQLQVFGILSGLAFLAVFWLKRRSEWLTAAGEKLSDASRVLTRPFSSLLLVLLVIALLVSELAPPILLETISVLVMLVLLRLLPQRLVAGNYFLLIGLAALFLLDRARAMLPFDSLAFRLDQLLVAAGLVGGYAYVLWLRRRGRIPKRSWLELLAKVAIFASVLLLGAIASNLVGNISLADLLVRGTLVSTFISAILFAAAFIVEDFVSMIVKSRAGQRLRMVTLKGPTIARVSGRGARLAAIVIWVVVTLGVFQLWGPVSQRVGAVLKTAWSFGQVSFSIGGIVTFVIGVLVAVYASRTVRFLLDEEILHRVPWPTGVKSTTATLAYYAVLFGGLLLALSAAGVQTGQFTLIVGALGVGIGFGLQNVVNNFVSGLILMFERPIQPGDIIDVGTLQGRVVEIGLRATRIRAWEGAEVVVPNGTLLSGNLINWTLSDSTRRVEVAVGVAYGTDIRRVLEILFRVASEQPTAMQDPPPLALFMGFGDSSLDFVMRFWTRDASLAPIALSEAGASISEALAAEGIEIPFPQRDLHIRSVGAGVAEALK
jgi:small-conductance mechanosensitive channel